MMTLAAQSLHPVIGLGGKVGEPQKQHFTQAEIIFWALV